MSAPDILTVQDPRDVDSILLRVPAALRKRVMESARGQKVSQNTYITAWLLTAVAVGEMTRLGIPRNLLTLLAEMDRAAGASDTVLLGFNVQDWVEMRPILELFASSAIIEGLKARRDSSSAETIVFTFHFSKVGLDAWKILGPLLKQTVDSMNDDLFSQAGEGVQG
jgi:hypothetical protein